MSAGAEQQAGNRWIARRLQRATPPSSKPDRRGPWLDAAARVALALGVVAAWQVAYEIVGAPALASPAETVDALVNALPSLAPDLKSTVVDLVISFAITSVCGVAIGFTIGLSAFWAEVLTPIVLTAYAVPKIVLYPVFLLVFGLTSDGRIAFAVLHGILPLIIVCAEAARNVPTVLLKVGRVYRLGFPARVWHVVVPSVMPSVVSGLRMAFALCFGGLVIAEIFASYKGLGHRLITYGAVGQTARMLGVVVLILLIALVGTAALSVLQRRHEQRLGRGRDGSALRF